MQRLLLTLRYDGSRYHGWQVQKNGVTVQETLQDAVERLTGVRSGIIGCSRTDSGVHANMFCCTFDTDCPLCGAGQTLYLSHMECFGPKSFLGRARFSLPSAAGCGFSFRTGGRLYRFSRLRRLLCRGQFCGKHRAFCSPCRGRAARGSDCVYSGSRRLPL